MGIALLVAWSCFIPLAIMFVCVVVKDTKRIKELENKLNRIEGANVYYNYRLITVTNDMIIDVTQSLTLVGVVKKLLERLDAVNAACCIEDGFFVTTKNPFNGELLVKRYQVGVGVPSTTFTIKKMDKGSIDIDEFMAVLKYVKENYYNERI